MNTKTFFQTDNETRIILGVDFGYKNDVAVETTVKRENGRFIIVSSKIIGKAKDFDTDEKREEFFKKVDECKI